MRGWLVTFAVAALVVAAWWLVRGRSPVGAGTPPPGVGVAGVPGSGIAGPGTLSETVPDFARKAPPLPLDPGAWTPLGTLSGVDAAVATPGGWALLSSAESRVVLTDPGGSVRGGFGRRGEGPGELGGATHLAAHAGELLAFSPPARLDVFGLDGSFRARAVLEVDGCAVPQVEAVRSTSTGVVALVTCRVGLRGERRAVRVAADGSTTTLTRHPAGTRELLAEGILGAAAGVLFHGDGDEPCLAPVRADPAVSPLCVDRRAPVPLPDAVRRAFATELEPRARAAGLDLEVPVRYPWLVDVLDTPTGPLAARPVGEFTLVLERLGAAAPARWLLPEGAVAFAGAHGLLVVHETVGGPRIQVVPHVSLR